MSGEDDSMDEGEFVETVDDVDKQEEEGQSGGLECDFSAYKLFHEGSIGAPCLSFDVLPDGLGDGRTCSTPLTVTFVGGTQASRTHLNTITLMKMRNLKKISHESDDDSELEDDEDEGDPGRAIVTSASLNHPGCVNRIRATTVNSVPLVAAWSETGHVGIWELRDLFDRVEQGSDGREGPSDEIACYTFRGHGSEGFALDWADTMPGTLVTGDCQRNIHVWKPTEGGGWAVNSQPCKGHTASVEDIQWSPNEANVFASCSVDRTIRMWDARANPGQACMSTITDAHQSDINVIHWNHNEPFIVSGGDDGMVKVWDLRQFQEGAPVAVLKQHNGPVTTVEWHPSDASVLASGGEDNKVLQWDLAVERDDTVKDKEDMDIPAQLLFEHQGQEEVKELHWHPQIPGLIISTALSGFNIFKTISC